MVFAFDTLGYAKRLESAGIARQQAEAHAESAREFIMAELVTKTDLAQALETQALRITVRITATLGAIVVAGVGFLAFLIRLQ